MANPIHLGDPVQRIETLLQDLSSTANFDLRDKAAELVRLLMELYGGGLAKMIEIVRQGSAPEVIQRLCADELISSLLILHDIHPLSRETRIQRALERVRPQLGAHGGDVKFVGLKEDIVTLRLEGSCDGCAASALTMKLAVEKAIEEEAPEVTQVILEEGAAMAPTQENWPYQACPAPA